MECRQAGCVGRRQEGSMGCRQEGSMGCRQEGARAACGGAHRSNFELGAGVLGDLWGGTAVRQAPAHLCHGFKSGRGP